MPTGPIKSINCAHISRPPGLPPHLMPLTCWRALKRCGNEELKSRAPEAALRSYNDAIGLLTPLGARAEAVRDLVICLSNRAEARLFLNSHCAAQDDCGAALRLLGQRSEHEWEGVFGTDRRTDLKRKLEQRLSRARDAIKVDENVAAAAARAARKAEAEALRMRRKEEQRRRRAEVQAQRRAAKAANADKHQTSTPRVGRVHRATSQVAMRETKAAAKQRADEQWAQEERMAAEREAMRLRDEARAAREQVVADRRRRRQERAAAERRAKLQAIAQQVQEREAALLRAQRAEEEIRRLELAAREEEQVKYALEMSLRDMQHQQELEQRARDQRAREQRALDAQERSLRICNDDRNRDAKNQQSPSSVLDEVDDDNMCSICQEQIPKPVWRPCGKHPLHLHCTIQWRDQCRSGRNSANGCSVQPSCPICREPI